MLARVKRTIAQRSMLDWGETVLVGVSGGSDSVALMVLLARLQNPLGIHVQVASVDHGLRPESEGEVRTVGRMAAGLGLPFSPLRLSLSGHTNVQAMAREARYAALWARARTLGIKKLAVGHTLDDQAETVLGRLLRGSGIRGLRGIRPHREDGLVRPLIDRTRAELRSYLRKANVSWVEDPTNQSERYQRVRLRAVIATLKKEDPALSTHLAHLADDAADIEEALGVWAKKLGMGLDALMAAPRAVRRIALRDAVERHVGRPPRRAHLEALDLLATSGRGEVWLGDGWRARPMGGQVVFEQGEWGRG